MGADNEIMNNAYNDFKIALYLIRCNKIIHSEPLKYSIAEWEQSKKLINQFSKN